MAVSRGSGHRSDGLESDTFLESLSRYDLLLAAIPLVLAVALLAGLVSPVPLHLAVGGGALLGIVFVADALYFHPPVDSTESARSDGPSASTSFESHGDD